jgi:hypothetical protein
VEVPNDELPPHVTPPVTGDSPGQNTGGHSGLKPDSKVSDDTGETKLPSETTPGQNTGDVTTEGVTTLLTRHIERLEAEISELRSRASDRDLIAGQLEGLRAVLDEVRQDRDQWQAMAQRPWWKRLVS